MTGFLFQPTLPARGATDLIEQSGTDAEFQPTLPARGATPNVLKSRRMPKNFNPRSRTGSDLRPSRASRRFVISTHAPRTGSDADGQQINTVNSSFQPTLPARGATRTLSNHARKSAFQPTLPARGATRAKVIVLQNPAISTHAPRTGSDNTRFHALAHVHISTHAPRTGSDGAEVVVLQCPAISTHAPRTGSDPSLPAERPEGRCYFNPRSPHGERQLSMSYILS